MKKNLTELVFILDESGSMSDLIDDTIGGFNSLIRKQKNEDGEALVSTVFFSNGSKVVHDRVTIDCVPELTSNDYVPSGCTALLDAVGDAVRHIANIHKYARKEDIPEKTLFVITTDGMENASRKYSHKDVKKLIERVQEENGWEFVFLGANIDAIAEASRIGICEDRVAQYVCDRDGVGLAYAAMADVTCGARVGSIPLDWNARVNDDARHRG